MGLKQDIIIVNEYTVKNGAGKGSRGSTPGNYLTAYMARDLATETLAPIRRQRTDDFIMRYMARESATEVAGSPGEMKKMMKGARGKGGLAFGYGQLSLSDEELRAASKDIQELYDNGHTVMKTVLSFDQEYLRKHGLIPEDFQCTERGDYRGQLDQMKLRMAITHGLDRMGARRYDDLRATSVIQVDTEHVHAHIVMADAGVGNLAKDGTQKGKIDATSMRYLRRGIDAWLDDKQKVAHLSSAVNYERLNVVSYIKRWTHERMFRESTPQFLLSCLPEDKSLWRAGSNRKEMRKPNRILESMIEEAVSQPGSPMSKAMEDIQSYADHRREEEGLSAKEWSKLVDTGRGQVMERAMNGVYGMLRALPDNELQVRTPMLDVMSMDYEELAKRAAERSEVKSKEEEDLLGFGFRLRAYSSRMQYHRSERDQYHEQSRRWEMLNESGGTSRDSRALYDFYQEEEEYHAQCAAKYQHFLPFTPSASQWYEEWEEVAQYGERLIGLQMMSKDQTLRRMKSEQKAEDHGQEVYQQHGGGLLTRGKEGVSIIEGRLDRMRDTYKRKIEDLQVSLANRGLTLHLKIAQPVADEMPEAEPVSDDIDAPLPGSRRKVARQEGRDAAKDTDPDEPTTRPRVEADITPGAEFPFEQVKALDLHHMRYDFTSDVEVGPRSRGNFIEAARRRSEMLDDAVAYLEGTDQTDVLDTLPLADVEMMNTMADQMEDMDEPVLHSHIAELARSREIARRSRTVRLSAEIAAQVDSHMALSAREAVDGLVISDRSAGREPQPETQAQEEAENLLPGTRLRRGAWRSGLGD